MPTVTAAEQTIEEKMRNFHALASAAGPCMDATANAPLSLRLALCLVSKFGSGFERFGNMPRGVNPYKGAQTLLRDMAHNPEHPHVCNLVKQVLRSYKKPAKMLLLVFRYVAGHYPAIAEGEPFCIQWRFGEPIRTGLKSCLKRQPSSEERTLRTITRIGDILETTTLRCSVNMIMITRTVSPEATKLVTVIEEPPMADAEPVMADIEPVMAVTSALPARQEWAMVVWHPRVMVVWRAMVVWHPAPAKTGVTRIPAIDNVPVAMVVNDVVVHPSVINKRSSDILSITFLDDARVLPDNAREKRFAEFCELTTKPLVRPNKPFSSEVNRLWDESRKFSNNPRVIKREGMPTEETVKTIIKMGILSDSQFFIQVKDCWLLIYTDARASAPGTASE